MKTRKMLPTLLLAILLSLTLFGCDSGGNASSGAANQPTNSTASSPPPSGGSAAASPSTAGGSNSTAANTSAGSGGDVKLTVVKYVTTADSNPGVSTHYLGIVKNEGNSTVTQLTVQVVDDSGQVQGIPASALEYTILPPGQSAGFNLEYVGADIKHPQFQATGTAITSDGLQPAQLSIVSSQFATSASGGQAVEGVVKNDSDRRAALWGSTSSSTMLVARLWMSAAVVAMMQPVPHSRSKHIAP